MNVRTWLEERQPAPPAELGLRLRQVLASALERDAGEAPESFLSAAEVLLGELIEEGSTTRDSAIDLLTVDALVTYAFEAAGAVPDSLRERASLAMQRIAALGAARP